MKFKVGDKVIIISNEYVPLKEYDRFIGLSGVITEIDKKDEVGDYYLIKTQDIEKVTWKESEIVKDTPKNRKYVEEIIVEKEI